MLMQMTLKKVMEQVSHAEMKILESLLSLKETFGYFEAVTKQREIVAQWPHHIFKFLFGNGSDLDMATSDEDDGDEGEKKEGEGGEKEKNKKKKKD